MSKFRYVTLELIVEYEDGEEWGDQLPEGATVKSVTVEYDTETATDEPLFGEAK